MFQRHTKQNRKMYRSVKYHINRDNDAKTADPSSCHFRIKRNSCLQSTMSKTYGSNFPTINLTINFNENLNTNLTYLQSFNSLMDPSQMNINKRKNKINKAQSLKEVKELNFFRESKQVVYLKDRIVIPAFEVKKKQVQDSEYSLLTPFNTPLSYVRLMTQNAQTELKKQKQQVREIKGQLEQVKKTMNLTLDEISDQVEDQINKFQRILRKNEIEQQEKKLKTKREIEELNKYHARNRNKFDEINARNSELQFTIFNSTPYNLVVETQQVKELNIVLEEPPENKDYERGLRKKMKEYQNVDDLKKAQIFYI